MSVCLSLFQWISVWSSQTQTPTTSSVLRSVTLRYVSFAPMRGTGPRRLGSCYNLLRMSSSALEAAPTVRKCPSKSDGQFWKSAKSGWAIALRNALIDTVCCQTRAIRLCKRQRKGSYWMKGEITDRSDSLPCLMQLKSVNHTLFMHTLHGFVVTWVHIKAPILKFMLGNILYFLFFVVAWR